MYLFNVYIYLCMFCLHRYRQYWPQGAAISNLVNWNSLPRENFKNLDIFIGQLGIAQVHLTPENNNCSIRHCGLNKYELWCSQVSMVLRQCNVWNISGSKLPIIDPTPSPWSMSMRNCSSVPPCNIHVNNSHPSISLHKHQTAATLLAWNSETENKRTW